MTDIEDIKNIFPSGAAIRWENADGITHLFTIAMLKGQIDKI
ncbi:hypothetical protein BNJ_00149 [Kaumoebavirus]|nr:hypothetical protein BNJ_00149 [Kaumoebavirus]ARA71981.1 hypothetical protein BNJ_00149 [Kaumoebavirus]